MAGFASREALATEFFTNGKILRIPFHKTAPSTMINNWWTSYWNGAGDPPAGTLAGAASPGTTYTGNTSSPVAGAICLPDKAPYKKYLLGIKIQAGTSVPSTVMLYDRLLSLACPSIASLGTFTINSGALPTRYAEANAEKNEVWMEGKFAGSGVTFRYNLASYTSADGTTGLVGGQTAFGASSAPVGAFMIAATNPSKRGVRSVETIQTYTNPVGLEVNLVILRPLAKFTIPANDMNYIEFLDESLMLPVIEDGACLAFATLAATSAAQPLYGELVIGYG